MHSHRHTSRHDKTHHGDTGKKHSFVVPVCELCGLDLWCEHDAKATLESGMEEENAEHKAEGSDARPSQTNSAAGAKSQHNPAGAKESSGRCGHDMAPQTCPGKRHGVKVASNKVQLDAVPEGKGIKGATLTTGTLGGTLQKGLPFMGDCITLEARLYKPDNKHPLWTITGPEGSSTQQGVTTITCPVKPPPFDPSETCRFPYTNFYWKPTVEPYTYLIRCEACKGKPQEALIRVWPSFKSEIKLLNFSPHGNEETKGPHQGKDAFSKIFSTLVSFVPGMKKAPEFKFCEGSLKLSNCWKEAAEAHALWEGEVELEMVVVAVEAEIPLAELNMLPAKVREIFDEAGANFEAGAYFQFKGELKAALKGVFHDTIAASDPPLPEEQRAGEIEGKVAGNITLKLGVHSHLKAGGNVLEADANANTNVEVTGKPCFDKTPALVLREIGYKWRPLNLQGSVVYKRHSTWLDNEFSFDLLNYELQIFHEIIGDLGTIPIWSRAS